MRTLALAILTGIIAHHLATRAQKPADRLERLAVHAWETSVQHTIPRYDLQSIAARASRQ